MPDKTEVTYTKMFKALLKSFDENQMPKSFAHDFEKGTLNSIFANFVDIIVFGCFFYFAQNLWKHLQKKD